MSAAATVPPAGRASLVGALALMDQGQRELAQVVRRQRAARSKCGHALRGARLALGWTLHGATARLAESGYHTTHTCVARVERSNPQRPNWNPALVTALVQLYEGAL